MKIILSICFCLFMFSTDLMAQELNNLEEDIKLDKKEEETLNPAQLFEKQLLERRKAKTVKINQSKKSKHVSNNSSKKRASSSNRGRTTMGNGMYVK